MMTNFVLTCFLSTLILFLNHRDHFAVAYPWDSPNFPHAKCQINKHPDVSDLLGTTYVDNVHAVTLPSGPTYRYVHYPSTHGKPTLLFLHGFPSSSFDWRHQFDYFATRGYGVVAPDSLGYGGTDKPSNPEAYLEKKQAHEAIELLDCIHVKEVVPVGHDLGSFILSRIATYFPNRSEKYIFLDIGYFAPGRLVTAANVTALPNIFGYWEFFNQDGAGYILDEHEDSLWSLENTDDEQFYWLHDLCPPPPGGLEAFLKADRHAPVGGFVSVQDEAIHNSIFSPRRGGYEPTLNHYRALYRNLNLPDENAIPQSAANLTKPVLLVTASKDPIGTPEFAVGSTRPFAPQLQIQEVESGHFVMLEAADEVNKAILDFISEE